MLLSTNGSEATQNPRQAISSPGQQLLTTSYRFGQRADVL